MKKLLIGAISVLFISAAAFAGVGGGTTSSAPSPVAPKDVQVKDELAKKDPKTLTKKEQDRLDRKKLMKSESVKNNLDGI